MYKSENYVLLPGGQKIMSKRCGHTFNMNHNTFPSAVSKAKKANLPVCRTCRKEVLVSQKFEEIKRRVAEVPGYKVVNRHEFTGNTRDSMIKVLHEECNTIFPTRPANFFMGKRCPVCAAKTNDSKIAQRIKDLLTKNGEEIEVEKIFPGCVNPFSGYDLRFDIYIPNKNIAIEIDGEQHHKPVKMFGGKRSLRRRKYLDFIKNKYCLERNIELLRLSMWHIKEQRRKTIAELEEETLRLVWYILSK